MNKHRHVNKKKRRFNLPRCMFQVAPHTGLVETLGLTLTKSIPVKKLTIITIFFGPNTCG